MAKGEPNYTTSKFVPCPECGDDVWARNPKLCPACASRKYYKEKRGKVLREKYRKEKEVDNVAD